MYQSKKAVFVHQTDIAEEIKAAPTSTKAREIAKSKLTTNKEWHQQKEALMYDIALAKLRCNPDIKGKLLQTKGMYLLEDTPISFWGRGPDGNGRNTMGKILMDIRDKMLEEERSNHKPQSQERSNRRPQSHDTPKSKPDQERIPNKVLLLGNSQADKIDPSKFSTKSKLEKIQLYTLTQVSDWLKSENAAKHHDAKYVVIHQITNDIKSNSEVHCAQNMADVVTQVKSTFPNAKPVISLGTPREDNLKQKVIRVNGMLREMYKDDNNTTVLHHENLQHRGQAKAGLLSSDGYHLTDSGTKVIASNIRHAVTTPSATVRTTSQHSISSQHKPYYIANRREFPPLQASHGDRDDRLHRGNYIMTRL